MRAYVCIDGAKQKKACVSNVQEIRAYDCDIDMMELREQRRAYTFL